jgi:DnaJ domain
MMEGKENSGRCVMTPANDFSVAAISAALDLLGLPGDASQAQILAAYRRLARTTHPDVTGRTDSAAGEGFAELHDAFELLTRAQPAEPPGEQPVGGSAEPVRPAEGAAEALTRAARPRPGPMRYGRVRTRRPIVAGPVIVSGLPDTHGTERSRR